MDHHATRVSLEAIIPTRGLIGFETDLVNLTRGEGLMSHLFREYAPFKGEIGGRGRGVMVSMNRESARLTRSTTFRNAAGFSSARRKTFMWG
jgi:GTP-binding protein